MRKVPLVVGEFYHVFNRGTDKRDIFLDKADVDRFFKGMTEFNSVEPIGSIYEHSFPLNPQLGNGVSKLGKENERKLVSFVSYCLNPNHYHFLLKQLEDRGIEKFMHRVGLGHAKYFNNRYKRTGVLFQGPFKAVHVESNEQLLHLSVYVSLNNKLGNGVSKLSRSSWDEYITDMKDGFCDKDIIIGQFSSKKDYKVFAESSLKDIIERKAQEVEMI